MKGASRLVLPVRLWLGTGVQFFNRYFWLMFFVFTCVGCGRTNSDAEKVQWVDPAKLNPGPIRHENLTAEQMARILRVQKVFNEVDPSPLEKWVEDFRRDMNPDRELAVWEGMASAFESFARTNTLTVDQKKEAFQIVLVRSGSSEEAVLERMKLRFLTEVQARELMAGFTNAPQPIRVMK